MAFSLSYIFYVDINSQLIVWQNNIFSTCPKKVKWGPGTMESDEDDRRPVKHRQSSDFSRLGRCLEEEEDMFKPCSHKESYDYVV